MTSPSFSVLDFLKPPEAALHSPVPTPVLEDARAKRELFLHSPYERETNVRSQSGRQLGEIEILQRKHLPEFEQLVPSITEALYDTLQAHKSSAHVSGTDTSESRASLKPFETSVTPQIKLSQYVWRIAEYTYTSPSTLLIALIYVNRILDSQQACLSVMNVYKLFFIAVRIASKVNDLRTLNNKNFAGVGGISNEQLNELEALFVTLLDFNVFVSPPEFFQCANKVLNLDTSLSTQQLLDPLAKLSLR